jgi:hypothetical protein
MRTALSYLRREKPVKPLVTSTKEKYHRRQKTHNRYGRIRKFIELLYENFGSLAKKSMWDNMSHQQAIRRAYLNSGISSFSAAVKIDSKYRSGALRNPITQKLNRKAPLLDQHREFIISNLRRWRALSLIERT